MKYASVGLLFSGLACNFSCSNPDEEILSATQNVELRSLNSSLELPEGTCYVDVTTIAGFDIRASSDTNPYDNTSEWIRYMAHLSANPSGCRNLYFPAGTYFGIFTSRSGEDKLSDLKIIGDGVDLTVLKMHPGRYSYPGSGGVVNLQGVNNGISDLTIDGDGYNAHQTTGYQPTGDGFVLIDISGNNTEANSLKLINSFNKQMVLKADDLVVINCEFISSYNQCTAPEGGVCVGKDVDGIHIWGERGRHRKNIHIEGCTFQGNQRAGVFIEMHVINVTIDDNLFQDCRSGVEQQGPSSNIDIKNNRFFSCSRGIYSKNGLGVMTVENNDFRIGTSLIEIGGGIYFGDNCDVAIPFTESFIRFGQTKTYAKLGHRIDLNLNTIEFVDTEWSSLATDQIDIIRISTYNQSFANNANTELGDEVSRFSFVKTLNFTNNTIDAGNAANLAPRIFRLTTSRQTGAMVPTMEGFVQEFNISGNSFISGDIAGPAYTISSGGYYPEIASLKVEDNIFHNLQGFRLIGDLTAFNRNEIYNNAFDAFLLSGKLAEAVGNKIYDLDGQGDSVRRRRIVVNTALNEYPVLLINNEYYNNDAQGNPTLVGNMNTYTSTTSTYSYFSL
ncbi:MAG TPA: hypothetical protein DCR93_30235 [Cytophagales bacterium]|nr:hypothetical protein [Cytophagales bacterium]HAP63590.1 hypothetical protein [Cytophagales bacterium]